jgi:DNA invertase Pin-like site-specific DNA recombinase
MIAEFAEFEHDLIVARTREGLHAARARGRNGGRKPKLDAKKVELARKMRATGTPVKEIAAALQVSRPTLYRYLESAS